MESVKRRKLNNRQMDLSSIEDIIVYDPSDSVSDNETPIENEVSESASLGGVSKMSMSHEANNRTQTEGEAANLNDDDELKALLLGWGVLSFLHNLNSCGINYQNLQLLEESDYAVLLRNDCNKLGDMITFRKFHRQWKNRARDETTVDVKRILKNGGQIGEEIKNHFQTNLQLTDSLRIKLVDLILKDKRKLSRTMLNNIADQICSIFPGEVKKIYYEKLKNKEPTGFLYERYIKTRTNKAVQPSAVQPSTSTSTVEDLDISLTDDVLSSIDFLKNDENFENCDTSLIIRHWENTFEYRDSKTYISATEAINDWLPLQKLDGHIMIHLDFVTKYDSPIANSFTTKFEDFTFRNQHVILEGIRDAKIKKTVLAVQSGNDVNIKNRVFIMALHHLSYTVPSKVTVKNVTWTPTIPDSKDSFLKMAKSSAEIDNHLKYQKKLCEMKNVKDHPIIFELNDSEGIKYIIRVGNTTYECSSLIDAVDTAFKIFVIFKIPFPPQCIKVWLFLNELFYKITLQQKPNAKIMSILNSYQM